MFNSQGFSAEGIPPDPEEIKSINQLQVPTNITEIKSLLVMTNFCSKFISDHLTITAPLPTTANKKDEQALLDQLKQPLIRISVLAFYNPNAATKIYVDVCPQGVGVMLTQQQQNGDYQPIAYGSQALTLTESYYSQTEPEALAVVSSCQHFHYYVYDNKTTTTIITDHKPLEKLLFSTSRVLPHVFKDGYYYYKPMTLLSNPADYHLRHPSRPSH